MINSSFNFLLLCYRSCRMHSAARIVNPYENRISRAAEGHCVKIDIAGICVEMFSKIQCKKKIGDTRRKAFGGKRIKRDLPVMRIK